MISIYKKSLIIGLLSVIFVLSSMGSPLPPGMSVGAPAGSAESDHTHAQTLGFATLALSTPTVFKLNRDNSLTMNMTSKGTGLTFKTDCYVMPSPSNLPYVAGLRSFFEISHNAVNGTSTATIEITFQTGLPTNGYMLFLDFDANEEISIKAYNASNVLIPYNDLTFIRHNGQSATGSTITTTVFTDLGASYSGKVEDEGGTSQNDIVVSLNSSQVIKRLVYEIQMNPTASTTLTNTMGFNFVVPTTPSRVYVNLAAGGANNGTSWTDAYTSLQTGIDNAFPGDELWVAKGTYKPSSAYERTNTSRFWHFRLPSSVAVYGGFVSGQTDTAQRTNYGIGETNETILTGDLNGDDNYTVTPWTGVGENSYHVIYHPAGTCIGLTTTLNGCTIKGGYANSTGADADGGGMYLTGNTSIRFNRVNLINNYTADDGAAMYLINGGNTDSSRVYFTDLSVKSNIAVGDAAMYLTDDSETVFSYVTFQDNRCTNNGGALHFTSNAVGFLSYVSVLNNSATGASSQGGGIYASGTSTNLQLSNVTITGNSASGATNEMGGGGIAIYNATASIDNGIISDNTATIDGGGMLVSTGAIVTIANTTISNNSADDGGGIYLDNAGTTINATGLTVSNNTSADDAGGIFLSDGCSMTAANLTVSGNTATGSSAVGGGLYISGASTLTASNLTLSGNTAGDDGGGLTNIASTVIINNGTIADNRCRDDGGGVKTLTSGTTTLNNCILWGNVVGQPTASGNQTGKQIDIGSSTTLVLNNSTIPATTISTGTQSEISGSGTLTLGSGNITTDPLFRNNVTGDYRLTSGSPAADAGSDGYNATTTDVRGLSRKLLKTNASTVGTIDMGAYEFHSVTDANKSWTGAVSNLWNEAGNWSDNTAPHANDILEIPSGTPQLNVDFTTDRSVTFSGTSTFTLQPTTGFSVGTSGTLAFGGRPIILKSDATGTARIGQVLGTISGATAVTVERYLPAGRKWRFLAAPLIGSTNTSIFYHWQNNGNATWPTTATGVEIWGPLGSANPAGGNGLSVGPHPSMRSYDATWQGITNTKTTELFNATTNNGFALFLTGPYNNGSTAYIGGPGNLPNGIASTLSATGALITGTHTKSLTATTAGQYFLIANPYASPVNPASFTSEGTINRTNLDNTLHLWDAKPGGTNGLGRYVSFSIFPPSYSNGGPGTGYVDNTVQIQSGQAFFVRATAVGDASLVFRETSKGSLTNLDMMGNGDPVSIPSMRFQLWQDTVNYDGAVAFFHAKASKGFDAMDGLKLLNGSDNLGFRRDGKTLVFEHHPVLGAKDTLFLHLSQMRQQPFRLTIEAFGLLQSEGLRARLIDRFTGRETDINLGGRTEMDFTIGADSASSGDRFMVVLGGVTGGITPTPELADVSDLRIYPNPLAGAGTVKVSLAGRKATLDLRVIDALGRTVWSRSSVGTALGQVEIDMAGLAAGVYHLILTDATGGQTVSKILKQ